MNILRRLLSKIRPTDNLDPFAIYYEPPLQIDQDLTGTKEPPSPTQEVEQDA